MKKLMMFILCLLSLSLVSCKPKIVSGESSFEITGVFYINKDREYVQLSPDEEFNLDDTIDSKIRINVLFKYNVTTNNKKSLPNVYIKGSEVMYDINVNQEYIGTVGSSDGDKKDVSWTYDNGEYKVESTNNIYIVLAEKGFYKIDLLMNYYEDDKSLCEKLSCTFTVK